MLKLLQKIYSETGEKQGPIPYTAILLGDGDNMGKTIDEIEDIRIHQHFSKALNRFAVSCEFLVKNHYGCLIYSGGDDVLAFVPLDQVLQCADEIQKNFATEMKEALPDEDRIPTFSIGIAIVHHLQPMGMSLQLAREAEKMAKNVGDRNALAIILDKRSGAPLNICAKWNSDIVKRLSDWTNYHLQDLMPDKLAYELRHLAKEMGDELKWEKGKPANATAFEFERILKRKRAKRGSKEMDADIIRTAGSLDNLRNLADELILTRLIADAVKQSGKETI
jgi:CRISPR-associated protein Cmr2